MASLSVGAIAACGKGEPAGRTEPSAAAVPAPGPAAEAPSQPSPEVPATLTERTLTFPPEFSTGELVVAVKLPPDWTHHEFFKKRIVPPTQKDSSKLSLTFERGCHGMCSQDAHLDNIARAKRRAVAEVTNPDPELFRLTEEQAKQLAGQVQVLADETLPNGAVLHAYRATIPEVDFASRRPIGGFQGRCWVMNPDDEKFLEIDASAVAENEPKVWPAFREICASASYRTPTEQ